MRGRKQTRQCTCSLRTRCWRSSTQADGPAASRYKYTTLACGQAAPSATASSAHVLHINNSNKNDYNSHNTPRCRIPSISRVSRQWQHWRWCCHWWQQSAWVGRCASWPWWQGSNRQACLWQTTKETTASGGPQAALDTSCKCVCQQVTLRHCSPLT